MQENQRMGFAIILGSVVFIVFVFLISDYLYLTAENGLFKNFMNGFLQVNLFEKENCGMYEVTCYAISFPTKWPVFAGICIAAYGLMVYKGVTRFPPCKKRS